MLASSPPDHSGSSARVRLQPSLPLTRGTGRELSPFACRHPSTELFHLQGSSSRGSAVDGGMACTARPLGSLSKWAASCANFQLCSGLTQIHPAAENLLQALRHLQPRGSHSFSLYSTVNQDDGVSGDMREGQPVIGFPVMGPLMQAGPTLSLLPH